MGLLSKLKMWLGPQKVSPVFSDTDNQEAPQGGAIEEIKEEYPAAEIVLSEEEQQFAQVKQFVASDDLSNHELAAMFMSGLGMQWDSEMCDLVSRSAEKMTFWALQENNEGFISNFRSLVISPRFFSLYSEIAEFAEILPRFIFLEELKWNAKHLWNQHPVIIAAAKLPGLKKLYARECRMNFLPESICEAPALEELYLSDNKLTEMPRDFGQLTNLRILDISANEFKKCPRSVCQLRMLETLRIHKNPLVDIEPRMLGRLYKLKDIQLPEIIAKFNLDSLKDWLPDVDFDKSYWQFD